MAGDYLGQEHQFRCDASIDGAPIAGSFDKFDGGDVTADGAEPYNAGGMVDAEAIAGVVKTDEVKIARAWRTSRDALLKKSLRQKINHPFVIGVQPLNPDKTAVVGALDTYSGILTGVTTPQYDSNGTGVVMFELTMTVSGLPT